jgi:taurine dioxygenase
MGSTKLRIEPMPVGAAIVDLEPAAAADPAVAEALRAAWLEHGMLLFQGVSSVDEHIALSSVFGQVEEHPLPGSRDREDPRLMTLGDGKSPVFVFDDGELRNGRLPWHRDGGYLTEVSKGGMLRAVVAPESDGETLFADTAKAYDELPVDLRERIDNLEFKASFRPHWDTETYPGTLWTSARRATVEEYPDNEHLVPQFEASMTAAQKLPAVVHRAVTEHPVTGRTCIFLSPKDFEHFLGMPKDESDELFAALVDHLTQDRYVYKHRWAVDDAIIWDNWLMMHAAAGYRPEHHRLAQRTTLAGRYSAGRLFDAAADGGPKPSPVPVA